MEGGEDGEHEEDKAAFYSAGCQRGQRPGRRHWSCDVRRAGALAAHAQPAESERARHGLLQRSATEQPAPRHDRVHSPESAADPALTMGSPQLVVNLCKAICGPSRDSATLRPADSDEPNRIPIKRSLQEQRWEQVSRVCLVAHQRRGNAPAARIKAADDGSAITAEHDRVDLTGSDVRVDQAAHQGWEGALTVLIPAACNDRPIAPEKNTMEFSSCSLRVDQAAHQRRGRALTLGIPAACHGNAILPKKNTVVGPSGNLRVGHTTHHRWDSTLTMTIQPAGHSRAIAPEKDSVHITSCNLRVGQTSSQRW